MTGLKKILLAGFWFTVSTLGATAHAKGWKAGKTSVSDFTQAEKKLLTGVPLSEFRPLQNYGKHLSLVEETLPDDFDWRNQDGKDFVTPVKYQGRCGSCVAFAATSTFETQMNIDTDSPSKPFTFSPQHVFACGGGACDTGWFTASGVDFVISKGVPEEACFPYVSGATGEDMSCQSSCANAKSRSLKAEFRVKSQAVVGASVEQVKQALLGGPVASSMKVFEDFYEYKEGVYRKGHAKLVGGHAVMIVGWSNAKKAWIARNSWGKEWGMNGDFMIAWDDPGMLGGTFYGVRAPKKYAGVTLSGVKDYSFVSGELKLAASTVNFTTSETSLELRNSAGVLPRRAFDSQGSLTLNTTELSDGVYTAQVRARGTDGSERVSQAHILYIRNGEVTGTLKIERMKMNMNVWDTIYPQFRVHSSPVPFAKIQYRLLNTQNEEVLKKFTEHTADLVSMSLKPQNLEKGHYTMIAEAIADNGKVVAADRTEFNVIEE
jgi:hypothetical protein